MNRDITPTNPTKAPIYEEPVIYSNTTDNIIDLVKNNSKMTPMAILLQVNAKDWHRLVIYKFASLQWRVCMNVTQIRK